MVGVLARRIKLGSTQVFTELGRRSRSFPSQTPGFNANDPANKEQGLDRPKFVQKIPGFGFGGPIIKNKTFFFVNFQWLRTLVTQINTNPVYTALSRQGSLRFVDLNSPIWSQQAYIDNGCLNVQLAI
jgi:hypothetical protein